MYQQTIGIVLLSDNKLATQFINSVLNQLNWAFSEFVGMIQEVRNIYHIYVGFFVAFLWPCGVVCLCSAVWCSMLRK